MYSELNEINAIYLFFYHTSHLSSGFMALPTLHPKSLAKSGEFEKGPLTLNGPGLWTPVVMTCSRV